MLLSAISTGDTPPHQVHVVIEVAQGSAPVKYELDKASGALFVDRLLATAMYYPCNYGFIPHTLSGDGDPCDVLVITPWALAPGCVIAVRPIGALVMEDESGVDEKILAVPVSSVTSLYEGIHSWQDLPELVTTQIGHFFAHYKDLERNKWVKIQGWESAERAKEMIQEAIIRGHTLGVRDAAH
jgi:inorganic pyrophosphatase